MKYTGKIHVVYDGMWGSCGKGKFCGHIALDPQKDINVSVCNNAPNAGHTFVFDNGQKVVVHQLPIGIVNQKIKHLVLGEKSVINIDNFINELDHYKDLIGNRKIYICDTAALVLPLHIEREKQILKTGSTFTGSGEALIDKIRRKGNIARLDNNNITNVENGEEIGEFNVQLANAHKKMRSLIRSGKIEIVPSKTFFGIIYNGLHGFTGNENILLEVSQGDGLSLNGSSYPYTTSRDCTPAQAICDIHAVDYSDNIRKYAVIRLNSIRINNKPKNDADTYMFTGDFAGAKEISQEKLSRDAIASWKEMSDRSGVPLKSFLETEISTTTRQLRRVSEFSPKQFDEMVFDTKPDEVLINFANYINSDIEGLNSEDCICAIKKFESGNFGDKTANTIRAIANIEYTVEQLEKLFPRTLKQYTLFGTGAKNNDIINLRSVLKQAQFNPIEEARTLGGTKTPIDYSIENNDPYKSIDDNQFSL